MEVIGIIVVLGFVGILLLLNLDNSMETKTNTIIGLLLAVVILLTVNAFLLYPQYKNNKEIQSASQELNN